MAEVCNFGDLSLSISGGVLGLLGPNGGGFLVTSMSIFLAIASRNAKAFIVIFLSFWYVVNDDHGASRWLDFAGFFGAATPVVTLTYFGVAAAAAVASQALYSLRLQRDLG